MLIFPAFKSCFRFSSAKKLQPIPFNGLSCQKIFTESISQPIFHLFSLAILFSSWYNIPKSFDKEGIPTEGHSKDDTPAPNAVVYLPIFAGCVAAALMSNAVCLLGGMIMSVMLMVSEI